MALSCATLAITTTAMGYFEGYRLGKKALRIAPNPKSQWICALAYISITIAIPQTRYCALVWETAWVCQLRTTPFTQISPPGTRLSKAYPKRAAIASVLSDVAFRDEDQHLEDNAIEGRASLAIGGP